ncbi:MAG: helix-turn-helix domain-containing protein [Oscillospiraceae bacterium]|nr:helix-turn-helix domain-containing protein [Oscillospiraceae bacterium]
MAELTFGAKLIKSAKQAQAHSKGNKKLRTNTIEILPVPKYEPAQIKAIRVRLGVTQGLMGGIIGVSTKTIESWESGYRKPSSTALRILAELDTNPEYFNKITNSDKNVNFLTTSV